jgi:hypothetical protein
LFTQVRMGLSQDGESDEVKRIFLEGNPYLLVGLPGGPFPIASFITSVKVSALQCFRVTAACAHAPVHRCCRRPKPPRQTLT